MTFSSKIYKKMKVRPGDSKSEPKDSKSEAKGGQSEPRGVNSEPKGTKRGPEGNQKGAKGRPKCIQNSMPEKGMYKSREIFQKGANAGAEIMNISMKMKVSIEILSNFGLVLPLQYVGTINKRNIAR